ncbi:MAG: RNA ligase family protein [Microcoleaceae cyanobacterium]
MSEPTAMIKWPSIELLHNLRRNLAAVEATPKLTYRAKIKLDGTNAAVQVFSDGSIIAQSRSRIITPSNDNIGFAQWLSDCQDVFSACAQSEHMTIFGEWCGKGIQKRTAISKIDRQIFAVFAIGFGGIAGAFSRLEVNPEKIATYLPQHKDIYVLPFYGESFTVDFGDETSLKEAIAYLNDQVETVEQTDPWVKATFDIEGLGEGLVLYPEAHSTVEGLEYNQLLFKAKGLKHQVVKTKQPVQLDPELAKNVDEFVTLFVTPNRLEQGLTEACQGELAMSQIGNFLKWFCLDVQKESVAELVAANLTWKDVNKAVSKAAREWYIAKVQAAL